MAVLCAMVAFASSAAAKHIVITYDKSGSMYRVGKQTKMVGEDVRRLNQHLLGIVFGPVPSESRDDVDKVTFVADGLTPLYAPGDEVTYVEVATSMRVLWERRGNVTRSALRSTLPDPTTIPREFAGLNSNLKHARATVYDHHYREGEETYWILVSDEDEDTSQGGDQKAASKTSIQRFEENHHLRSVFGMTVNDHVNLDARLVVTGGSRGPTGVLFIAAANRPTAPVKEIEFTRGDASGVFESQPLVVVSSDSASHAYECEAVIARFVDGRGAPNGDPLPEVALGGDRPPRRFVLSLAADSNGAAPNLRDIRLRVAYRRDGNVVMSPGAILPVTWRIDDVFIALATSPGEPVESLSLSAGADGATWISPELVVSSTNPDTSAFALHQLFVRVLSKNGTVLDTGEVAERPARLGTPWRLALPADKKGIDFEGNTIEVAVSYAFAGDPQRTQIPVTYSVRRGAPSGLRWLLWLILACALVLLGGYGLRRLPFGRSPAVTVGLTRMDASRIGETQSRSFVLRKGARVELDGARVGTQCMDIGCPGYILHRGNGALVLSQDGVSVPSPIRDGEEVQLETTDGAVAWLRIDIEDGKAPGPRTQDADPLGTHVRPPEAGSPLEDGSKATPASPLDL